MTILYGGSFNPPTIAHYKIACYLLDKFSEAKLQFLPANNFYEKDNLKDYHYRCQMLELLCQRLGERASINDFEIRLDKYYGSWYTIKHFPNAYFVIGADNLLTIHTWINYPAVVREGRFLVIPRDQIDIEAVFEENPVLRENRDKFLILDDFPEIEVSSSLYRKTKDEKYLLPEVAEFIRKNDLYKE
jgi:nicotinate-nucleotide adenylyltransferase